MKGILLALFALSATEGALAQYNADQHERAIRSRCTSSSSDWEEVMGCMRGDIQMIEQIRRRERADARAAAFRRKQQEKPLISRVPVEEAPAAPAPRVRPVTPAPERTRPAPRESDVVRQPPAAPAPRVPEARIPGETRPSDTTRGTGPIAGTSPLPGPSDDLYNRPAAPVQPRIINPEATAPRTEAKPRAETPPAAKPEAEKPAVATAFARKCARTLGELNKQPELMAAVERIMGVKPAKGAVAKFEVKGTKQDIGRHCYDVWSAGIYACKNRVPDSDPIITRVNQETGEIQTYTEKKWYSVNLCSDGSMVTNDFQIPTPVGSTLHVKATFKRFGDRLDYSANIRENTRETTFLAKGTAVLEKESTGLVAGRTRNVSGRN